MKWANISKKNVKPTNDMPVRKLTDVIKQLREEGYKIYCNI